MKQVKLKIETTVEAMLGDKPVNELLKDITDLCHERLEYSTSKMMGVKCCMRIKSMKITGMIWRIGYLYLKVHFVKSWICWGTNNETINKHHTER